MADLGKDRLATIDLADFFEKVMLSWLIWEIVSLVLLSWLILKMVVWFHCAN